MIRKQVQQALEYLTNDLIKKQSADGSWRFSYESGVMTDAYMIITLRTLKIDDELLIRALHHRISTKQETNGAWKVYPDEQEGNLSATVEAVFALLYSKYSQPSDPHIQNAKHFIETHGGISKIDSLMTRIILTCCGQNLWPSFFPLPLELLLVPSISPVNFFDFSGYARVHLAPVMLLAEKRFIITNERTPELSNLFRLDPSLLDLPEHSQRSNSIWNELNLIMDKVTSLPDQLHQKALHKAEQFMLDRIEADGTLYSYSSATIFMIFALLSLGYDKHHPPIARAVQGLKSLQYHTDGTIHIQNSSSTVWDTALISHALQQANLSCKHPTIQASGHYLLSRQHDKLGDWSQNVRNPVPGGWGFSDINTLNPDVDDTTAALRAIHNLDVPNLTYRNAFNKGLQWIISMQNKDGGWPAFEKKTNNPMMTLLPFKGAAAAAIDPSTADLTGRTLEFLGKETGLTSRHSFIHKAVSWLQEHQETDGSWYGRWGICYIYGTWAALTGMIAVGENQDQSHIRKGAEWLSSIQNSDGGWGESCSSDHVKQYVPLHQSTLIQTAWAVDALIACYPIMNSTIINGINYLLNNLNKLNQEAYPTGAGLPGQFYSRYHSYPYIWPLLALSHYKSKYEDTIGSPVEHENNC
ncbi:terpene cyclase/mutase family protein [Paenibacillus psychroresistens]|nr:prenyltransferase/squalene oxidase repeat-containing protein [Paenibacillus psychroresistens]